MTIAVPLPDLADEVQRWGAGFLVTVSDDGRPHILALTPTVADAAVPVLRFDASGGRACRNATVRDRVSVVFPPGPHPDGYSLVIDGTAAVDGVFVDVAVTSALLHRAAP